MCDGWFVRRRMPRVCCLREIWRSGHRDATLYTRVSRFCAARVHHPFSSSQFPSLSPFRPRSFPLSLSLSLSLSHTLFVCAYARSPRSAFNSLRRQFSSRSRCRLNTREFSLSILFNLSLDDSHFHRQRTKKRKRKENIYV